MSTNQSIKAITTSYLGRSARLALEAGCLCGETRGPDFCFSLKIILLHPNDHRRKTDVFVRGVLIPLSVFILQ
jgi:hypothetical protein